MDQAKAEGKEIQAFTPGKTKGGRHELEESTQIELTTYSDACGTAFAKVDETASTDAVIEAVNKNAEALRQHGDAIETVAKDQFLERTYTFNRRDEIASRSILLAWPPETWQKGSPSEKNTIIEELRKKAGVPGSNADAMNKDGILGISHLTPLGAKSNYSCVEFRSFGIADKFRKAVNTAAWYPWKRNGEEYGSYPIKAKFQEKPSELHRQVLVRALLLALDDSESLNTETYVFKDDLPQYKAVHITGEVIAQAAFWRYRAENIARLYIPRELIEFAKRTVPRKIKQLLSEKDNLHSCKDAWHTEYDLQWIAFGDLGEELGDRNPGNCEDETNMPDDIYESQIDRMMEVPRFLAPGLDSLPEAVQKVKGKGKGSKGLEELKKQLERERCPRTYVSPFSKLPFQPMYRHYLRRNITEADERTAAIFANPASPNFEMQNADFLYDVQFLPIEELERALPSVYRETIKPTKEMLSWGWQQDDTLLIHPPGKQGFRLLCPREKHDDNEAETVQTRTKLLGMLKNFIKENGEIIQALEEIDNQKAAGKMHGKGKRNDKKTIGKGNTDQKKMHKEEIDSDAEGVKRECDKEYDGACEDEGNRSKENDKGKYKGKGKGKYKRSKGKGRWVDADWGWSGWGNSWPQW